MQLTILQFYSYLCICVASTSLAHNRTILLQSPFLLDQLSTPYITLIQAPTSHLLPFPQQFALSHIRVTTRSAALQCKLKSKVLNILTGGFGNGEI